MCVCVCVRVRVFDNLVMNVGHSVSVDVEHLGPSILKLRVLEPLYAQGSHSVSSVSGPLLVFEHMNY